MDQRLQEYGDQADANCMEIATRLDRLETNWRRTQTLGGKRVPS